MLLNDNEMDGSSSLFDPIVVNGYKSNYMTNTCPRLYFSIKIYQKYSLCRIAQYYVHPLDPAHLIKESRRDENDLSQACK